MAEYIWLGGSGSDIRSKTKVLDAAPESVDELPVIAVDGDSCGQADAGCCEVYLKPRKMFRDPFRGAEHILVLCDVHTASLAVSRSISALLTRARPGAAPNGRLAIDLIRILPIVPASAPSHATAASVRLQLAAPCPACPGSPLHHRATLPPRLSSVLSLRPIAPS